MVSERVHAEQPGVRRGAGPAASRPPGRSSVAQASSKFSAWSLCRISSRSVPSARHLVLDLVLDALAGAGPRRRVPRPGGRRPAATPRWSACCEAEMTRKRSLRVSRTPTQNRSSASSNTTTSVVGRGADHVPPYPVRPPRLVHGHVEQRRAVGRPGGAVERAGDLVGRGLARDQVLDPHREPLAAGEVGGVGEQPPVGAHVEGAQGEELLAGRQFVPVEQDLLAVQRAPVPGQRRP